MALAILTDRDVNGRDEGLAGLTALLVAKPAAELLRQRDWLISLATGGKTAGGRAAGYAAWITADGSGDDAFAERRNRRTSSANCWRHCRWWPIRKCLAACMAACSHCCSICLRRWPRSRTEHSLAASGIKVDFFAHDDGNVTTRARRPAKPKASGIVPAITLNVPHAR